MTQHLGLPPRPWAGLESHLHAVPQAPAPEPAARREVTAIALVLGYLARKRGLATAG